MAKDSNPLAPLGRRNEEEWVRRHEAEVLDNLRKKKKPAKGATAEASTDGKPEEPVKQ